MFNVYIKHTCMQIFLICGILTNFSQTPSTKRHDRVSTDQILVESLRHICLSWVSTRFSVVCKQGTVLHLRKRLEVCIEFSVADVLSCTTCLTGSPHFSTKVLLWPQSVSMQAADQDHQQVKKTKGHTLHNSNSSCLNLFGEYLAQIHTLVYV